MSSAAATLRVIPSNISSNATVMAPHTQPERRRATSEHSAASASRQRCQRTASQHLRRLHCDRAHRNSAQHDITRHTAAGALLHSTLLSLKWWRVLLRCVCLSVVSLLLSWLPVVQCAARTYSAYFRCLIRFARSRADLRQWMVDHGAIAALVDLYTCNTAVPQFNCRVSPPVLSYIVQQQQVSAPRSLQEAHATLLASFATSAHAATVRRMHPHNGHLAITLLALLVQHVTTRTTRKQSNGAKYTAVAAAGAASLSTR